MIRLLRRLLGRGPAAPVAIFLALALLVLLGRSWDGSIDLSGDTVPPRLAVGGGEILRAEVRRVIDGDTVEVAIGEGSGEVVESVRYIGIDTPEPRAAGGAECYAEQATERNNELVGGETVRLELGSEPRDRYDRLLAYVFLDDSLVNTELVAEGYATTLEIPPNVDRAERLERAERLARERDRGLWAAC